MTAENVVTSGAAEADQGRQPGEVSAGRPLTRVLLAFAVGIGGEFALLLALMPLAQGDAEPPLLIIGAWLAGIGTKAVVPILMRRDGESWRKLLGVRSLTTWLYGLGGLVALALGMRLLETRSFPMIAREFEGMLRMSDGTLSLALFMLLMQFLYYGAEGVLMAYVVMKGSEATAMWRPGFPTWLAGMGGGLLLGVTWGLPHILSTGSLTIGLMGLAQGLLYGVLYGMSGSGLPIWLAWMGFLTF
jgi:hypothetical protein